jgi:hypothetical protein
MKMRSADPMLQSRSKQNLEALKRFQAYETACARLIGGWLPGVALWEAKHTLGRHLWEDIQHSRELRMRLWELRISNPAGGADVEMVAKLVASAQRDYEFIAGLYLGLKESLLTAYEEMARTTHAVYDAPTLPVLDRIIREKRAQLQWASATLESLTDNGEKKRAVRRWVDFIRETLNAVGGVAGTGHASPPPSLPPGYRLLLPFAEAKRDERFKISLTGMDIPAPDDRLGQTVLQFFNYSQEMQAAETLGSVLWEADGLEWDFYFDVARHCYDEVRHSKLGETRLAELGHAVTDFPNCVANYGWRQLYDPLRRYCVLTYVIEADGFAYKHKTYQQHVAGGDLDSAEAVLYDIIDETLHVRWGQKWTPKLMEAAKYPGTLESLVAECRGLLARHSVSPLQREANARRQAGISETPS